MVDKEDFMELNNRPCPICSTEEKRLLYKQDFLDNAQISLVSHYDVVVCDKCGFVYADQIPSQAEADKHYANMSKYEINYREGQASQEQMDHFVKIVDFIQPHIPDSDARILDIGCSTGGLLSILKSRGYSHLLGIDPSPACARSTKQLYGIESEVNDIAGFHSNEKFDLVILSAVLEHIIDFDNSMQKIRSLIKDSGLLFLEVPDAERFESHIFGPFQQFSTEHINYFSQYSLQNFLSRFSFKMIEAKPFESRVSSTIDPDIFLVAQKTEEKGARITKDTISEPKVMQYIEKCLKIDSNIKDIIANKLSHRGKIIVWGTGVHTQRLIRHGFDPKKILYFVDSNKRFAGKKLDGIEIKLPEAIREEDIPILISTHSYQEEIVRQIKEGLKLSNEIITIY